MKTFLIALFCLNFSLLMAQGPIGTWKTIDDETKKPKSHVKIYEQDGKVHGKIIKLLDKASDSICDLCPGALKDQPIVGMDIVLDLNKDGNEWNDGTIMDPKTGKVYSCFITLEGNDKLKVRGYIGFSLLGRTQIWHRID